MGYLVSVVIPAFNVEKYIDYTIESILGQENYCNKKIQIIIVDDGSTDNTQKKISKYLKNQNFKLLSQCNKGVSAARNLGINNSEGKYILFLDGDDILSRGMFNRFDKNNYDEELIVGNRYHLFGKRTRVSNYFENKFSIEKFIEYSIENRTIFWNMGGYVVRKDFLEKNRIFFCEELSSAEDLDFFLKILRNLSKVKTSSIDFFDYRLGREGSAMNIRTKDKIINQLKVYNMASIEYKKNRVISNFFSDFYLNILSQTGYIKSKYDKKEIINYSKKTTIPRGDKINYRVYSFLYKILGINLASNMIVLIRGIRKR